MSFTHVQLYCSLIESLEDMEDELSEDEKMSLVYILGYISSNNTGDEGASFFTTKNMERM